MSELKRPVLVYFSTQRLALNQEVKNHPELLERLQNHDPNDFEIQLAEIAAYCDVMLDGYYTGFDIDRLCDILVERLKMKRSAIILLN